MCYPPMGTLREPVPDGTGKHGVQGKAIGGAGKLVTPRGCVMDLHHNIFYGYRGPIAGEPK